MHLRLSLCAAVGVIAGMAEPSASLADFKVCNRTSAKEIYIAFGVYHGRKGWESEGWYPAKRGECTRLLDQMGDRYYYLYVEGDNDVIWDGKGDEGSTNFCVKVGGEFTLNVAAMSRGSDNPDCEKNGYTTKRFMRVDTERYGDYTFEISD